MTKRKSTKRALLMSALALLLCVSMLIGTTYAWFTDSVTSSGNIIKAGKLDVAMEWKDATATGAQQTYKDAAEGAIFNYDKWEPGYVEAKNIKISNAGTLAFKYQLHIIAEGEVSILADVIDVFFAEEELLLADRNMTGLNYVGTLREVLTNQPLNMTGEIKAGDTPDIATIALKMREEAGNDYQGKAIGSSFAVQLVATQLASEEDSFNKEYDAPADYPVISVPAPIPSAGSQNISSPKETTDHPMNINIPKEMLDELKDDGVTELTLVHTEAQFDTVNKTVNFRSVELVDQNGNVVDLASLGTDKKIIITLPVGNTYADGEAVLVYHDGELMGTAIVSGGKMTYEAAHLCEIDITATEEVKVEEESGAYVIENLSQLYNFAQEVNGGNSFHGKTVLLANDIDLNGYTWAPIGNSVTAFRGTFDGQGHTISNLCINMPGKSNVGLFGMTTDGKVMNLTVKNATVTGRLNVGVVAGTPYTTQYSNITLIGHVEVNGMAYVGGIGGKNAYANWSDVTVNVDETSYVKANSVENGVAYRTYVGGACGFNGEGTHSFTNVTSNIDVIGTTCDVGGLFGIAHYGNKFVNCSSSGDVTITDAAEAADAEEMGGVAGVWHNGGANVVFLYCSYTGKLTANITESVDLSDNTIVGAAYSKTGPGKLVFDQKVDTAEEFAEAVKNMEEGGVVVLTENVDVDTIELPEDVEVSIDLNGNQLSVAGLEATADVEITGGTLVHKDATYPAVSVADGGNLVLNDVNIVCNKYCNLYVSGSLEAAEYVGLQVFGGTCELNNCNVEVEVDKVRYANSAYGIAVHDGKLIMNGGSVKVSSPGSTKADFQAAFAGWQAGEKTIILNDVTIDAKNYFEAGGGNTTIITNDANGSWEGKCVAGNGTYTVQYK